MNDSMIEVGDLFVITRKCRYRNRPCPYADKVFVVKSFTNSGLSVYYDDGRTNIKCKCNNCQKVYRREYVGDLSSGDWIKVEAPKCIGINDIRVVEKRLSRERDIKIKLLGL